MAFEDVQPENIVTDNTSELRCDLWVDWLSRSRFSHCQQPA